MAATPAVRAHADPLDVPGPQRAPAVEEPSLHERGVAGEDIVLPDESVDAAERDERAGA